MTMNVNGITTQGSVAGLDSNDGAADPTSATGSVDACGALLPPPSVVTGGAGDIGAEIALLGLRAGQDEQRINVTAENAENDIQDAAEQNEVNEMHTEADDIMSNAVAAGMMQICQGGLQAAAGGASTSGAQAGLTGEATMAGAAATLFTAQGQAETQNDQAIVTADKAVADRAGQSSTEASQAQSDARSVISNAIQVYQEYQRTTAQIDLTAAGQRA